MFTATEASSEVDSGDDNSQPATSLPPTTPVMNGMPLTVPQPPLSFAPPGMGPIPGANHMMGGMAGPMSNPMMGPNPMVGMTGPMMGGPMGGMGEFGFFLRFLPLCFHLFYTYLESKRRKKGQKKFDQS